MLGGAERSIIEIGVRWRETQPDLDLTYVLPARGGKLGPALKKRGLNHVVVPSYPWLMRQRATGAERLLRYQRFNAIAVSRLVDYITSKSIDIVVTNSIVNPWGAVAAAIAGVRHVWLVREFGDLDHGLEFQYPVESTWRDINALSDVVVANSEAVRNHILSFVPEAKVEVSYPPVHIPTPATDLEPLRSESDDLSIVCVGTLCEPKGQVTVIEALGHLRNAGIVARATFVGAEAPRGYGSALQLLAADRGVVEQVEILPPSENVGEIVSAADVAVMPSRFEAFGRTTLEYMLLGKPVVGSNSGGTPELIEPGVTGYLAEPGDAGGFAGAIARYARHPELIREHGEAGQRRAREAVSGPYALEHLLALLTRVATSAVDAPRRAPSLVLNGMRDAGRVHEWALDTVKATQSSAEYRIGSAIVRPARKLRKLARQARQLARELRAAPVVRGKRPRTALRLDGTMPALSLSPEMRIARTSTKDTVKDAFVAAALVRRGLVDRHFYGAQVGRRFGSELSAARHFLSRGLAVGAAPSPLFEPEWTAGVSGKPVQSAVRYVAGHGLERIGIAWSAPMREASTAAQPSDRITAAELLAPRADLPTAKDPRTRYQPQSRFQPAAISLEPSSEVTGLNWSELRRSRTARDPEKVSILMLTYNDWKRTVVAVDAILALDYDRPIEVVLVDNGSLPFVGRILRSCYADEPRVVVILSPHNLNFAGGSNLAYANSSGDRIVFLNNDTEVQAGWLTHLLEPLEDPAVLGTQPLLTYPDGTVQTAGTIFGTPGVLPRHFLVQHPVEDVLALPDYALDRFSAVTAACLAMRADQFAAVRGFDELFANGMEDVDLCLRLQANLGGHFKVVRESRVVHHESLTPGRGARTLANRERFLNRWHGNMPVSDEWRYSELGLESRRQIPRSVRPGDSQLIAGTSFSVSRRPELASVPRLRLALRQPKLSEDDGLFDARAALVNEVVAAARQLDVHLIVDTIASRRRDSRVLDEAVLHFAFDEELDLQPGTANIILAPAGATVPLARFADATITVPQNTDERGMTWYRFDSEANRGLETAIDQLRRRLLTDSESTVSAASRVVPAGS